MPGQNLVSQKTSRSLSALLVYFLEPTNFHGVSNSFHHAKGNFEPVKIVIQVPLNEIQEHLKVSTSANHYGFTTVPYTVKKHEKIHVPLLDTGYCLKHKY